MADIVAAERAAGGAEDGVLNFGEDGHGGS